MSQLCSTAIVLLVVGTACTLQEDSRQEVAPSVPITSEPQLASAGHSSASIPTPDPAGGSRGNEPAPTTIPVYPRAGLRTGDVGSAVSRLQNELEAAGFRTGDVVDGVYGPGTASAVLAFEKYEGLERDGVADPEMLGALAEADVVGPRSSVPGPGIDIDLERQILFATTSSGELRILNTSTGNGELYRSSSGRQVRATTPVGNFRIERRIDGVRRAFLGSLYRPLYFKRGWAIHGSGSVPAYPASHGCARVRNDDQDWLFESFENGVSVNIHRTLPRFDETVEAAIIY
ncbi:MAG: L,D-transpeptidase family protein [Acidimicrobiales bacterium]